MAMHYESKPVMSSEMPNLSTIPIRSTDIDSSIQNMEISVSSNLPINVTETTANLNKIQNFPVVKKIGSFHIHQDPITGQMYRMTNTFHGKIPEILKQTESVTSDLINETKSVEYGSDMFRPDNNVVEINTISDYIELKDNTLEFVLNSQSIGDSIQLPINVDNYNSSVSFENIFEPTFNSLENNLAIESVSLIKSMNKVPTSTFNQTRIGPMNKIPSPQPVQFSSNVVNQTRIGPMNKIPSPQPVQFSSNVVNQTRVSPRNRVI